MALRLGMAHDDVHVTALDRIYRPQKLSPKQGLVNT